jgi:signal transduction histidine kinase
MRLRSRYILSLLALVAVMVVPAVYGVGRVDEMHGLALELHQHAAGTAVAAGRLSRHVAELDRHQRSYVVTADAELIELMDRAIESIQDQADVLSRFGYRELVAASVPVAALRASADSIRTLMEAGSLDEATTHLSVVARPLLGTVDEAVTRLSEAIDRDMAARAVEAERIAASAVTAATTAILLALLAAIVLAWFAARLLTRPLERLGRAMEAVAQGRLDAEPDPALGRNDEVGMLFRSFHAMTWRLVQLDRMKAELVALASHDLKTPISVITGYAELLEEAGPALEPHHRSVLRSLDQQVRVLGSRVDQLTEFSRMEAHGLRLGLEEINIRHLASGLETAFAPVAHRQGVDLAVSVSSDAPTFLVADPDCLRVEIVGNILEHSIKFSPRGSLVRIEFRGDGERRLQVEIRDQGPPVPPELAGRLFDRYYRGPAIAGRIGSGLALPIAHAAVQAHGGRIDVRSDDVGTRFILELPLRPGAAEPERTRATSGG